MTITSKMTTLLKDEVIDLMSGGTLVYDAAGNLLVLTTDAPSDATYTSVVGFGYADVAHALGDWSPPTSRIGRNAVDFEFPAVDNAVAPDTVAYQVNGIVIERATSGEALYSTQVQLGKAFRHLDEPVVRANGFTLDFNNQPNRIGAALVDAVYNATLRGQTINAVTAFALEFTQNTPSAAADTVLSIPAIEIGTGVFGAAAAASSLLTAAELTKYGIDADARATTNSTELRTETLTQDYPEIGGWRIRTDGGDVWWRGALSPEKFVYEDSQLKILSGAIVLAI